MPLDRDKIKPYGWVADIPDQCNHLYAASVAHLKKLPSKVNLRAKCAKFIYDQGDLGGCTGNAIACAIQFDRLKQKRKPDFIPSRLFIYYNERNMEGTIASDSGTQVRDGIKSVTNFGDCPKAEWPYKTAKFTTKPLAKYYRDALKYKAVLFQRVIQTLNQMKGCLASGYPVVFGFSVFESFEIAAATKSGIMPIPASSGKQLGGHAVLAVGYDDTQQRFIVRNSGYFTMPNAYLTDSNLSDDSWTIQIVAS
jgi:C1A family cysteine protease